MYYVGIISLVREIVKPKLFLHSKKCLNIPIILLILYQ